MSDITCKLCGATYPNAAAEEFCPHRLKHLAMFTAEDLARARQAGFDEAREMAAKICDERHALANRDHDTVCSMEFTIAAKAIRAMQPRDGGE